MESAVKQLKNNKKRLTKQRLSILSYLSEVTSHPSAEVIYNELKQTMPNLSLGTVYRNLKYLSQNGLILQINSPTEEKAHFDGNITEHWHFICENCHKLQDIWDKPVSIKESLPENLGKVRRLELNLYGLCSKCQSV